MTMKVINLLAGPGAGKSTTAAGLFNLMKLRGHKVELVTEFAKDLTWSGRRGELENQLYILAKQESRLARLEGKVDWAITDSPLILGLLYTTGRMNRGWFKRAVVGAYSLYDNIEFFIERVKPYSPVGRNQDETAARMLDLETWELARELGIAAHRVLGDDMAPHVIYDKVTGERP